MATEKRCPRCAETKALSAYSLRNGRPQSYCKPCATAKLNEWLTRAGNRDRLNRSIQAGRKREPEKHRARALVRTALASGRLTRQPCEVADGCDGPVQAHHDDYTQPLAVRWLCRRHHEALHHAKAAA